MHIGTERSAWFVRLTPCGGVGKSGVLRVLAGLQHRAGRRRQDGLAERRGARYATRRTSASRLLNAAPGRPTEVGSDTTSRRAERGVGRTGASTGLLGAAASIQAPLAVRRVRRLRALHPLDSPTDVVGRLARGYEAAVTASGAGASVAARSSGLGAIAAFAAACGDAAFTVNAGALYVLARAEVHGHDLDDVTAMTTLLRDTISAPRHGAIVLGRVRLAGLGMRTGASGNAALAAAVLRAADRRLGRPPVTWDAADRDPMLRWTTERRLNDR